MRKYLLILLLLSGCAFEVDGTGENCTDRLDVVTETDTKYKTLFIGPCSYTLELIVHIPYGYEHYKDNIHYAYGKFGVVGRETERGQYGFWDSLFVNLPCGACLTKIVGGISVLDGKFNHVPWGCGIERPPLNVHNIRATFTKRPENEGTWEDNPPEKYEYSYVPELVNDKNVCDGELVLLDYTQSCEVLVEAGQLEYK